ncbi:MAG: OmpH family outer membrane protein [Bacteroidetes bacterium]|nr:OmpH family outer membrane protein [Bacteroidota bacterium]
MIKHIAIAAMATVASSLSAQKMGFVDTDLILGKLPEYKSAQKQLDDLSAQWQQKATDLQAGLDQMYKDFKGEELLLSAEQKRMKEDAIVEKEKELFKFREDKFGQNGELFKKREELIKPVQDKVYEAVQKVAKKEGLSFMFDKAGGVLMLYADQKYDKTYEVMEELGIPVETPGTPAPGDK